MESTNYRHPLRLHTTLPLFAVEKRRKKKLEGIICEKLGEE
jgi:hypothetical protein